MIVLDTDVFSHLLQAHPKVVQRYEQAEQDNEDVVITDVTRVEILRGRFQNFLTADDGEKLGIASQRLRESMKSVMAMPDVPVNQTALNIFDELRAIKKLRKIGRPDLLIACITLAYNARLATRNTKDFSLVPRLRIENWVD